jgi:hypothetical protein
MPTQAAPPYSVPESPPGGGLGVGTVKVPVARETPLETITAPAQFEEYSSAFRIPSDGDVLLRIRPVRRVPFPYAAARAVRGDAETALTSKMAAPAAVEKNFIVTVFRALKVGGE